MKRNTIIYWVFTALFALGILAGVGMYFTQHAFVAENFDKLGFPTWLVYPLATAKILGIVGILQNQSQVLKEWTYAGFFFNLLLAISAHLVANDGEAFGAAIIMTLMLGSYVFSKRKHD